MNNYRAGILTAGEARARSIPAAVCDERATKPAVKRPSESVQVIVNGLLCCTQPRMIPHPRSAHKPAPRRKPNSKVQPPVLDMHNPQKKHPRVKKEPIQPIEPMEHLQPRPQICENLSYMNATQCERANVRGPAAQARKLPQESLSLANPQTRNSCLSVGQASPGESGVKRASGPEFRLPQARGAGGSVNWQTRRCATHASSCSNSTNFNQI
jgi:hypothetical protein